MRGANALVTVSLGTRLAVVLADVIVLAVTWINAFGTVREARRAKIKVPLSQVLIRDGRLITCLDCTVC